MLRNTVIYPLLSEPAAIAAKGLTVNYLLKTDEHRSTAEEMLLELKIMQSMGLVTTKASKWALTDNGLAAAMSQKLDSSSDRKPAEIHGGILDEQTYLLQRGERELSPKKKTLPPKMQDLSELLATLGQLSDVNLLKEKIELITQLHKWLNPDIGDVFAEIIDELEKLQEIATLAQKCLVNKN